MVPKPYIKIICPQGDRVKTTMKKSTPKIISKSVSRMPKKCLVGQKNLVCHSFHSITVCAEF